MTVLNISRVPTGLREYAATVIYLQENKAQIENKAYLEVCTVIGLFILEDYQELRINLSAQARMEYLSGVVEGMAEVIPFEQWLEERNDTLAYQLTLASTHTPQYAGVRVMHTPIDQCVDAIYATTFPTLTDRDLAIAKKLGACSIFVTPENTKDYVNSLRGTDLAQAAIAINGILRDIAETYIITDRKVGE